jgi:hypothetical protein
VSRRYHRRARFDQETLAGDLILMNPETHAVVVLNPAGALVWEAIAGGATAEDIVGLFGEASPGVALDRVRADVTETLERLLAAGLATLETP